MSNESHAIDLEDFVKFRLRQTKQPASGMSGTAVTVELGLLPFRAASKITSAATQSTMSTSLTSGFHASVAAGLVQTTLQSKSKVAIVAGDPKLRELASKVLEPPLQAGKLLMAML
eukprot:513725-Amphidinium_carterae.1